MNRHIHRISQLALAGAIALLVGCGSTPQQPKITLPDPQTVPREQWSDALNVFDAMGLKGQRDIPKAMLSQAQGQQVSGSNVVGSAGDVFVGPSAGLGLGLFLLGGGGAPAEGIPQVAAWVPADKASSPQEAIAVVTAAFEKARIASLDTEPRHMTVVTARYPTGWNPSVAFASIKDSMLDIPVQFNDGPHPAPASLNMGSKRVYGPIFIHSSQISLDAGWRDPHAYPDQMLKMSSNLPDWFYLYYPGSKFSREKVPAAVYHTGKTLRFVSK